MSNPRLKPLEGLAPEELRVSEIFPTLQGESSRAGWPTTFVRLTACDLRCNYCDAAHAFAGGEAMTVAAVVAAVQAHGLPRVCLTGGEPLLQTACPALCAALLAAEFAVSVETHGGLDIGALPAGVARVVDVKTPGSGEGGSFLPANLGRLTPRDEVKFVLSDRADYEFARGFLRAHSLPCAAIFSPAWGRIEAGRLAEWVLEDRLPVRVQVQLHKILWGAETRR